MNAIVSPQNLRMPFDFEAEPSHYQQIDVEYDPEYRAAWTYMNPAGAPCFNLGLLKELRAADALLKKNGGKMMHDGRLNPVDYYVVASRIDKIFNLGGDLALFTRLIQSGNREGLRRYARLCVDNMYARICNYDLPLVTVSLVQGEALGGGFETALSSNVIIAEESARMGLPEILFNLFPGMGAYSLLARRLGMRRAEEMIMSGRIYTARELYDMDVIDVVAPDGGGEHAVYEYFRRTSKTLRGARAVYECRRHFNPVSYEEMLNITEVWVDTALRIEDKDIKLMNRLVRSQQRFADGADSGGKTRTPLTIATV